MVPHMDQRSLNVLEFPKLLEYLSAQAVSEAGVQACRALRPGGDAEGIAHFKTVFEEARAWLEFSGFKLVNFPNLGGALDFLSNSSGVLDLDALWTLRDALGQAGSIMDSVNDHKRPECPWPVLQASLASHPLPERSISALHRCISDDGYLKDSASPELALVRGEIRRIHQQCSRKVGEFIRQYSLGHYLQDEFMTLSSDRFVLPLKSNFKGKFQGVIHDYSQTGETCYFEPMFLVEVNNRLQELKQEEREEERKVFAFLSDLLRSELDLVKNSYRLMVETDVLQAKMRLAAKYDGNIPSFGADNRLNLKNARHPLLALGHLHDKNGRTPDPVATDITLRDGQRVLIVSGGNAGGKTVCLKTLGLITLMGMCGIPAPVDWGGTLPLWSFISPFIGDEQSLEDHVSTFTAQISQLTESWSQIGPGSLIILDEFGAGTDPAQGAALAQAVIDELMEKGAYVFAATHFPALKAYALSREGVRAASVLFDPKTKKPLFRLVYDQVGASQALDVAREHGLPESVLKKAQQYLLLDGEDTSQLIERLNALAVEREKESDELRRESAKFRKKRAELDERFARERKSLFDSVQAEAQKVLAAWKASKISNKQALKDLARVRRNILQAEGEDREASAEAPALDLERLAAGQRVKYLPWQKPGQVVEVDRRRRKVRLDLSGVTIWTDFSDLAVMQGASGPGKADKADKAEKSGGVSGPKAPSFALHLDLRGQRADVALAELERFIDSAILGGRDRVEVVHGRGTGALRREIHAYLKNNPAVKLFTLAPEDQGGDGMTIIELK